MSSREKSEEFRIINRILVVRAIESSEIIQYDRKVGEPTPLESVNETAVEKSSISAAPTMPPFSVPTVPINQSYINASNSDQGSVSFQSNSFSNNVHGQYTAPLKTMNTSSSSNNDPFIQPISSLSPYNNKSLIFDFLDGLLKLESHPKPTFDNFQMLVGMASCSL